MTSKKKVEANRRNAQLSTGPKSTDGTRQNATRHGILSGGGVIQEIDGANACELYEELRTRLWEGLVPVGYVEEDLVCQMAEIKWRRRRLRNWETSLIQAQVDDVLDRWENPTIRRQLSEDLNDMTESGRSSRYALEVFTDLMKDIEVITTALEAGQSLAALPDPSGVITFAEKNLG